MIAAGRPTKGRGIGAAQSGAGSGSGVARGATTARRRGPLFAVYRRRSFYRKGRGPMKKAVIFALVLAFASATSAIAQDIRYNFDKQADFAKFKTFKWVTIKGGKVVNDLVDQQIRAAIESELALKGLVRTDADAADLYIGYQAAVDTEKEYTSFDSGWGYGPGYGGGWYGGGGMSTTTGTTSTIYIGQLAVDMYQAASKTLVWRGSATKTLDTRAKPEKQQKNLAKAMTKLFKNYPPPVKK
jgi:Domain of unknown function (DUF4136)